MIRQPKTRPARCACGTCRVCADDLTRAWAADQPAPANKADLRGGRRTPLPVVVPAALVGKQWPVVRPAPRPAPGWPVVAAAFDAHMAALHDRLNGGSRG